MTKFKRMNFFTGFFTTAQDWNDGQAYHLEKRRLHNQRLHTPGIIRGEQDELRVEAAGGRVVRVLTGAALDGNGNVIYLDQPQEIEIQNQSQVYITIAYAEENADIVINMHTDEYSGPTRIAEKPRLAVTEKEPDNQTQIELARILSSDAHSPINEIDRGHIWWAGAADITAAQLTEEEKNILSALSQDTREIFTSLSQVFPVSAADDVRHAALTIELLLCAGQIPPGQLVTIWQVVATAEKKVAQEIVEANPALEQSPEFIAYDMAVDDLGQEQTFNDMASKQDTVLEKAAILLETKKLPVALIAGDEFRVVTASGLEAAITLDAGASFALGDREIKYYHWTKK